MPPRDSDRPFDEQEPLEGPGDADMDLAEDDETPTVACPHCGEAIYDDAPQCPHCGQYVLAGRAGSGRTWWMIMGVLLAGLAMGLYLVFRVWR